MATEVVSRAGTNGGAVAVEAGSFDTCKDNDDDADAEADADADADTGAAGGICGA